MRRPHQQNPFRQNPLQQSPFQQSPFQQEIHRPFPFGGLLVAGLLLAGILISMAPSVARAQEAADTVEIEPLIVTATPVPVPAGSLGMNVTVIDGGDLRDRGITRVADALRTEAGATLARSGSYGAVTSLFLRGGESDYVQVMVDGVSINQPGGSVDLSGLTTEAVERIEIVRGPSSALYGSDAVAGVVNIITRRGADGDGPTIAATARGGSYGRLDGGLDVRGGGDRATYGISLAQQTTDGILAFNNEHENLVLHGNADLRLDERSRVRFTARLSDRDFHFPTDFTGAVVDTNQRSFSEETTVGFELGRTIGSDPGEVGSFDVRALLSLHDQESGTDDVQDTPADTLGSYGFQSLDAMERRTVDLRGSWRATDAVTLTAGVEHERQQLRSFSESQSQFGEFNSRFDEVRSNRAGYLHGLLGAGPVDFTGGFRMEDNEHYGGFLTWQVGGSWTLDDATRIRASAGRAIKEPTFYEAYSTGFSVGNPDLEPERSTSWEVGAERELGAVARISLTWFDQAFRDLIQYTFAPSEPGGPNYFNVAAADARGLELGLEATLVGATWSARWTHLDTEVVDSGFDQGEGATFVEGAPLLRRPSDEWLVAASGTAGSRVRWHASLRHVGEREDRDFTSMTPAPVTLDAYTLIDAGVDVRVRDAESSGPGVNLFLKGENLTDEAYEEVFGYPSPGRAVVVGGRMTWGGEG